MLTIEEFRVKMCRRYASACLVNGLPFSELNTCDLPKRQAKKIWKQVKKELENADW